MRKAVVCPSVDLTVAKELSTLTGNRIQNGGSEAVF